MLGIFVVNPVATVPRSSPTANRQGICTILVQHNPPLESTLTKDVQVFILNNLKLFRMNTYEKKGEEKCNVSPFRMNTYESVSKQRILTLFRMNTYEKQAGWGGCYG